MTTRDPHLWPDDAADAITAELVRLTVGGPGPTRPELRVDLVGAIAATLTRVANAMRPLLDAVADYNRKQQP